MPFVRVDHPAVDHRLAKLRDGATPPGEFRRHLEALGALLAFEATRNLARVSVRISTPLEGTEGLQIERPPVAVPILRAGLGLVPGFLSVVDDAELAHVGYARDAQTLEAVPYYANLPQSLAGRAVFVLDPMLATGHSACAALDLLQERGADDVLMIAVIAAPEGIAYIEARHPHTTVFTASVDRQLDDRGYILPGLGDAGDRLFGTIHR